MMRALILMLPMVVMRVSAWAPAKVDVTQQASPPVTGSMDHLEPADKAVPPGYYLIRFTSEGGMEYQNDFLTITRREYDNKFIIEKWSQWALGHKAPPDLKLRPKVRFEIPSDLALMAYEMWINALYEVRYDRRCGEEISDADTDIFSAYVHGKGWLSGITQESQAELPPKWMEEAAASLMQFTNDRNVEVCRDRLTQLHEKLFSYWQRHGISF